MRNSSVESVSSTALGAAHAQPQTLFLRRHRERAAQSVEHRVDRDGFALDLHLSGIEPRDVQQIIEQLFQRIGAQQDLVDQLDAGASFGAVAQRRCKQPERMQRLAQVVIGRRKKSRFGAARLFGSHARLFRDGRSGA